MAAEFAGQLRGAARCGNDVGDLHGAIMWDMPALPVKNYAGLSRTWNADSAHNAVMARKLRRTSDKKRTPLAQRIIALRKERGLKQVELAAEANVSRSHISKIETGDDVPGLETLHALAAYFRVSMDYLQTGSDAASLPREGRFVNDVEQLMILDLWEAIPKEERPRVARMIEAAAFDPAKVG